MSRLALLLAIAAVATACASRPIANRPVPPVEPESVSAIDNLDGLDVRCTAVWDEDWIVDNFGANAILARALPVRVVLANGRPASADVRGLAIVIRDIAGNEFRQLGTKAARKHIERTYPLGIRSAEGERRYRADFESNALDLNRPLAAGEVRQGFVFFEMPESVTHEVPLSIDAKLK